MTHCVRMRPIHPHCLAARHERAVASWRCVGAPLTTPSAPVHSLASDLEQLTELSALHLYQRAQSQNTDEFAFYDSFPSCAWRPPPSHNGKAQSSSSSEGIWAGLHVRHLLGSSSRCCCFELAEKPFRVTVLELGSETVTLNPKRHRRQQQPGQASGSVRLQVSRLLRSRQRCGRRRSGGGLRRS